MTSLTGTPAALTAYLRRATWGLPKARQQELWDELEEHVLTRVDHLCALGSGPEEALAQALRELGPPTRVSAGMTQVYLMPKLLLSAGAAALALSAALYALAGGNEGNVTTLPVLTQRPVKPTCVRGTKPTGPDITFISEKDGVICYTFNDAKFYRGAYIGARALSVALASAGGSVRRLPENRLEIKAPQSDGGFLTSKTRPLFILNGEGYLSSGQVFSLVVGEESGAVLHSFRKPVLQFGRVDLQFGDGTSKTIGHDFYNSFGLELISRVVRPGAEGASYHIQGLSIPENGPAHRIQTRLTPDEVVMLITRQTGENYELNTAPVGMDGSAQLRSSQKKLRYVKNPAELSPYPSGGRVPTLLVRVTNVPLNNLKQGIFLPIQPTSDAN